MGVHGLWKIVESSGETIKLEELNHHRLAIDASIWAHQFLKSSKLKEGGDSAALVGFLRRILKLLFYNVKPVFVFDGVAPSIKRKVLKQRREQREKSKENLKKTAEKILQTQLQVKLLDNDASHHNSSSGSINGFLKRDRDAFELPALENGMRANMKEDDLRYDFDLELLDYLHEYKPDMKHVNLETLDQLPLNVKYDVVSELRGRSRQTSHHRIKHLKKVAPQAKDFSQLQVENLMQRNKLTQKYLEVVGINEETSHLPGANTFSRVAAQKGKTFQLLKNDQGGWKLSNPNAVSVPAATQDSVEVKQEEEEQEQDLEGEEDDVEQFWVQLFNAMEDLETLEADDWDVNDRRFELEDLGIKIKQEPKDDYDFLQRTDTHRLDSSPQDLWKTESETKGPKKTNMFSSTSSSSVNLDDEIFEEVNESPGSPINLEEPNQGIGTNQPQSELDLWKGYLDVQVEPDQLNIDTLHRNCTQVWSIHRVEKRLHSVERQLATEELDSVAYDRLSTYVLYLKAVLEARTPTQPIELNSTEGAEEELFAQQTITLSSEGVQSVVNLSSDGVELVEPSSVPVVQDDLVDVSQPESVPEIPLLVEEPDQPPFSPILPAFELELELETSETQAGVQLPKPIQVLEKEVQPESTPLMATPVPVANEVLNLDRAELQRELQNLAQLRAKQERQLDDPTQQLYEDIQQLLQILGIPYLVAEGEAEAQCAYLSQHNLVDGIVSDDSDVLLFGGSPTYRYLFHSTQQVEKFTQAKLQAELQLTRDKLIDLAQLLGSDYALGVPGVGPVTALHILTEFPSLEEFKNWWERNKSVTSTKPEGKEEGSALRQKLRKLARRVYDLPHPFPDLEIRQAYLNPEVDSNLQKFTWGQLQLKPLQQFLKLKLDWDFEKTLDTINPLLKHRNELNRQPKITSYFSSEKRVNENLKLKSKVLNLALKKFVGEEPL